MGCAAPNLTWGGSDAAGAGRWGAASTRLLWFRLVPLDWDPR
jgi:hypothetical protein